jgi:hypothetical protein
MCVAKQNRLPPPPASLVERLQLSPFYRKCLLVGELPVLGSEKVTDAALYEAAYLLQKMLRGRDDLAKAIPQNKVRVAVMAYSERTLDIPEHADLTPRDYWNRRARGLGATPWRPAVSCGEENLLEFPGDPYRGESILIHEFAHVIHQMGLHTIDSGFEPQLKECYAWAVAKGFWRNTYAETNLAEYWAEGVQSYFDANAAKNAVHNGIRTRSELARHDPLLYELIAKTFRGNRWRWVPLSQRSRDECAHLGSFDRSTAPSFRWE